MSFSTFTEADFNLIRQESDSLMEMAQSRCRNEKEVALVRKALDFAGQAHLNVRRRSGEPYILHPIAVAKIVISDIGLGYKSIVTALLHDVVEDTDYTVEDIREMFGEKISQLVEGLTKIKTVLDNEDRKGSVIKTQSVQAENLKRILLTLNDDVRVVLIKLADRLHNCRTIEYMPEHKRDKILSETMFIFIPLAHRLGFYSIKSEMENIWLKYKEPEAYQEISKLIEHNSALREKEIDDFIAPIEGQLRRDDFDFTIKKRIKTPYSIWYKMKTKNVPFEQIYDLYAVRIIFDPGTDDHEIERKQAYMIYADIIGLYKEKPGRHRDWIENPKSNGYEALHSTLMSQSGIWIEAQIRSKRMDDIAEKGIAAHWLYKREGFLTENESQMDKWLAKVQEILVSEDVNALELLDIIHNDLVSTDIVVFTPKGDQKTIQNGATVLDFAYMIHSDIGRKAIASKVNMKLSPLSQVLKSGDQVEIITAGNGQPKIEWLQFLQTRYAKTRVIDFFKDRRQEIAETGRKIYLERLAVMGCKDDENTARRFTEFTQIADMKEIYFRIGLNLIGPEEFKYILDANATPSKDISKLLRPVSGEIKQTKLVLANCCNPIPGDPVEGLIVDDETVIVHKKSCVTAEHYTSTAGAKVIALEWIAEGSNFPVRISMAGIDRIGLLRDITEFISGTLNVNIRKLQLGSEHGIFEGYFEILVSDRRSLDKMIEELKKIDGLQDVIRTDI